MISDITEIETTQDDIGIYGLKFTTSNMRNIELFGDEQRFINCMSTESKLNFYYHQVIFYYR